MDVTSPIVLSLHWFRELSKFLCSAHLLKFCKCVPILFLIDLFQVVLRFLFYVLFIFLVFCYMPPGMLISYYLSLSPLLYFLHVWNTTYHFLYYILFSYYFSLFLFVACAFFYCVTSLFCIFVFCHILPCRLLPVTQLEGVKPIQVSRVQGRDLCLIYRHRSRNWRSYLLHLLRPSSRAVLLLPYLRKCQYALLQFHLPTPVAVICVMCVGYVRVVVLVIVFWMLVSLWVKLLYLGKPNLT